MPFHLFIMRDGIACLISSSILFSLGYHLGENLDDLIYYYHRYTFWFLSLIASIALGGLVFIGFPGALRKNDLNFVKAHLSVDIKV